MTENEEKEFFYSTSTNTGDWGGYSTYSGFIKASTPEKALNKVWKEKELEKMVYADRSVQIYDGYNYRMSMPELPPVLAKRFKAGDGSRSSFCNNPDCPYC